MATPVVIYTSRTCPFCLRAEARLKGKGVAFERRPIWRFLPGGRRPLAARFGPEHTSVPQIVIGETHVGGCDGLVALERSGRLDALLAGTA